MGTMHASVKGYGNTTSLLYKYANLTLPRLKDGEFFFLPSGLLICLTTDE